jgi:hypothetical protein
LTGAGKEQKSQSAESNAEGMAFFDMDHFLSTGELTLH